MLKQIKSVKLGVSQPVSEAEYSVTPNSLPNPTPSDLYIGYSPVNKPRRRRFRLEVFEHNPALSPAPPEIWIGESENESTSFIRKQFHTYLEVSLGVQSYRMRPVKIPFIDRNGQTSEYEPLFILQYWGDARAPVARHRYLLGDIRCDASIHENADWFIPAWRAASRWANAQGFNFKVFRNRFFLSDYFSNVKFMKNYWRLEPDAENWRLIDRILQERNVIKFSELIDYAGTNKESRGRLIRAAWTLVAIGCVGADWQKRFNQDTVLWLN